jgi:hypothetical protein
MGTYTLEQLREDGPQFAMAMLLRCLDSGEPFVTYGAIRDELEFQLRIDKIFPTQIGHVAGSLMDRILGVDPKAPLINALITRPDGLPGVGIAGYFANRYNSKRLLNWDRVPAREKRELVNSERNKVLRYSGWERINSKLFGSEAKEKLRRENGTEEDGKPPNGLAYGGAAESEEHKKLKKWVSLNPEELGLSKAYGKGIEESPLLSGDVVDVLFANGSDFVMVEVKSCLSNDVDLRRGLYQCVKYRHVKEAEHCPHDVRVRALLVTERELNPELVERARLLGIPTKVVAVNTRKAK